MRRKLPFLCVLCALCSAIQAFAQYDILIRGGRVVDGTGNPWFQADVAITGDRIAAIGKLEGKTARRVIDARGLYVAPGFIDMLGQSEFNLLVDGQARSKIKQGITTEITGEGESIAPVNAYLASQARPLFDHFHLKLDWQSLGQYFARLERQGIGINLGTYVGATQVRAYVLDGENRAPTPAELEQMKALVDAAMREGALGLSTSLVYAPAFYARTDELIELARVAARYGGVYATHMRSESMQLMEALEETIRIGREAQIPVEIFHLKVAGKPNWGKMPAVIQRIEKARAEGVDLAADQYPYLAGATALDASLPRWAHEGGREKLLARLKDPGARARMKREMEAGSQGWENFFYLAGGGPGIMLAGVLNPDLLPLQGKTIAQISAERKKDPVETLFDILLQDNDQTGAIYFIMSEEDVRTALRQPWVSLGLDAGAARTDGPLAEIRPHPRAYGSAARWLARYVRDEKLLPLEEAIRKMTSLAAQRLNLNDRGLLKPGFFADLAVFDLARVQDRAAFENPAQYAEGFRYVLVNGKPALDNGEFTGALAGRVLRGPGASAPAQASVPAGRVVDLTHVISENAPVFMPAMRFEIANAEEEGEVGRRLGIYGRRFCASEHLGTHVDAPNHFGGRDRQAVDQLEPAQLVTRAVVVDVSASARGNPDYQLSVSDLERWEKRHGRIPEGSVVVARTGWGSLWNDSEKYRNPDASGTYHFPGFSPEAARMLVERRVAGLAIDTLSVDYGPSKDFPVHFTTQPAGLYHIENLAHAEALPESGAVLIVSPLKLAQGSGSPARVWAIVPQSR